jgi:hypothetical protein
MKDLQFPFQANSLNGRGIQKMLLVMFRIQALNEMNEESLKEVSLIPKESQDELDSTNNANQKLKSRLVKHLQKIFNTNDQPIKIDRETKLYKPVFRSYFRGDLAIRISDEKKIDRLTDDFADKNENEEDSSDNYSNDWRT